MNDQSNGIQSMLEESLSKYIRDYCTFEKRSEIVASETGFSPEHWQLYAELGWLSIPVSEQFGGLGCGASELYTVMQQLGRANVPSPYLTTIVLCTELLETTASKDQCTALLGEIVEGNLIVSPAIPEAQSRYDLHNIQTVATKSAGHYLLNGRKIAVPYGNIANCFLVLARTKGNANDREGLSLFLADRDTAGLEIENYRTHDGRSVSSLHFSDAKIPSDSLLGVENQALGHVEQSFNHAAAASCAEMNGIMWAVFEITLEFIKTRSQFDSQIGKFQAIQHRVTDMYMKCELAQSMAENALRSVYEDAELELNKVVSATKWSIGNAAVQVAEEAVHLHGAMGMTNEMPVGHYLKRVASLNLLFGDPAYHQNRYRTLHS